MQVLENARLAQETDQQRQARFNENYFSIINCTLKTDMRD